MTRTRDEPRDHVLLEADAWIDGAGGDLSLPVSNRILDLRLARSRLENKRLKLRAAIEAIGEARREVSLARGDLRARLRTLREHADDLPGLSLPRTGS